MWHEFWAENHMHKIILYAGKSLLKVKNKTSYIVPETPTQYILIITYYVYLNYSIFIFI